MSEPVSIYTDILYSVDGSAAVITLNRVAQMNSWRANLAKEVRHAIARAEDDKNVVGIIITGNGKGFCAGADMTELQKATEAGELATGDAREVDLSAEPGTLELPEGFAKGAFSYLATVGKPVIAAVNGAVAGIGVPLILFCDMRFFAESGYVATSFSKRGLSAEAGTAWILPKLVGPDNALDILWSSRKIYGPEAQELGLATRVFPDEELVDEAVKYINRLAEDCSPSAMAIMKGQVYRDLHREPAESFRESHRIMKATLKTFDFKEGVKSFIEKRKAQFERLGK